MSLPTINIEDAIEHGVINAKGSRLRDDYQKVTSFMELKGRPSRPIDERLVTRERAEFDRIWRSYLPKTFFDPFNWLLARLGLAQLKVEPDESSIALWNQKDFVPRLSAAVTRVLDAGEDGLLIPKLVATFLNLEREEVPAQKDWSTITIIAVPGSRTYDRAAEAFRAYLRTQGNAFVVCSGQAPYYDEHNQNIQLTEAEANAAYLRMLGVPAEKIKIESLSRDTSENVDFLTGAITEIEDEHGLAAERILLVTSPFHLARFRLSVNLMLESGQHHIKKIYAMGSKASRYWAESYFLTDAKSGYTREMTMGVVFNEYLKIAFDLCTRGRVGMKALAKR